ncbi:MAG: CobW family GTP-binding protein [Porticoccaceae bacterium]
MSLVDSPIPTNIITGFLGAGKTTAIQSLLAGKPAGEPWAVLVNEFGEVGIDSRLTGAAAGEVVIREVPGGCMCCTSGLPMQVALNQLIGRARPRRLLIEPTGLGHPREVIEVLGAAYYRAVVDLRATLTLVDARNLEDGRYTGHDIFNQQLEVADLIVASKADLYGDGALDRLAAYLAERGLGQVPVAPAARGMVSPHWLDLPRRGGAEGVPGAAFAAARADGAGLAVGALRPSAAPLAIPPCGYLRVDGAGEGLVSSGWLFAPRFTFAYRPLYNLLCGVDALRLKGVFITDQGVVGFNGANGVLSTLGLDDSLDSRIELIGESRGPWAGLEQGLLDCRLEEGEVPGG